MAIQRSALIPSKTVREQRQTNRHVENVSIKSSRRIMFNMTAMNEASLKEAL